MSHQTLVLIGAVVAIFASIVMVCSPTVVAAQSKPTILNVKTNLLFDVAVMKNEKTPFVVFYYSSSECLPCMWSLLPMLEKIIRRKAGVNLAMVDLDKLPELKEAHGITEIPTTMVFYKGDVMDMGLGKNWNPIVALVNRAIKLGK